LLVAGVWAGLAWNGTGRVPFILSGVATAVLAVVLLTAGRFFREPVDLPRPPAA
jgi:hypothetical protein